jgi:hypothetical protein
MTFHAKQQFHRQTLGPSRRVFPNRAQTRIVASVAQLTALHVRGIPARYAKAERRACRPSPMRVLLFVQAAMLRLFPPF